MCSRESRRSSTKHGMSHRSNSSKNKKLKKLRVVDGKNQDEIIIVSSSDYDMLVASGAYEPVGDSSEEVQMKEVYGKHKSPYKRNPGNEVITGPRVRTIVLDKDDEKDAVKEETLKKNPIDLFDNSLLAEDMDLNQYIHKQPIQSEQDESEGKEEGWSFSSHVSLNQTYQISP